MNCNCSISCENVIRFIKGTTVNLLFDFDEDISGYTSAQFVIRKDYETDPVIDKTVNEFQEKSIALELTPDETNDFTEFVNGKNSAQYIWGLDLLDSDNNIRRNVYPQVGNEAPLCIVYKHVVTEE